MEALAVLGFATAFRFYRSKKLRKETNNISNETESLLGHDNDRWMMVAADEPAQPGSGMPAAVPPSAIPSPAAVLSTANAAGVTQPPSAAKIGGVLPMGESAFVASTNEYSAVSFGAGKGAAAAAPASSVGAASMFPAALRPADMGIMRPLAAAGAPAKPFVEPPGSEDDGNTMYALPLAERNAKLAKPVGAAGSSIQVLPPVLTGGAAEYGYSILQVRRNRSLDLRGDIKPFMPENNPCDLWRSSYAEQAKYNKPVNLIHNEVIPMPPTYDQLKNFFAPTDQQKAMSAAAATLSEQRMPMPAIAVGSGSS